MSCRHGDGRIHRAWILRRAIRFRPFQLGEVPPNCRDLIPFAIRLCDIVFRSMAYTMRMKLVLNIEKQKHVITKQQKKNVCPFVWSKAYDQTKSLHMGSQADTGK